MREGVNRPASVALRFAVPTHARLVFMPFAEVNEAQIYYHQAGEGPDLILLHGAGGNHLSWWQQVAHFSGRYRCTVYDARGWGRSVGDMDGGRGFLGADLVALLGSLEIERAHVVAHSMGGRAVAGLVRMEPERIRALVLSGTTAGATNDRVREYQTELRAERAGASLRLFALADEFERQEPALSLLYRQINQLNPPRPKGFLGRPPPSYKGSMHESIAETGAPVMFMVGEHDKITSPAMVREAAGLIPGSTVHEITGAGHSSYFEQPDEFNAKVQSFLSKAEADGR